ncbi:MAG: carbohydrate kinase [Lachnospiraceae bacterium]|nr:carbohydrate kinase [Lachnospiraceae bacterium]
MDLYSIGEMVIDFIPGSEPFSYIRKAGGAPANVAIAMVKNGLTAGMCCSVGDDDFGRFLYETLRENNVSVMNPVLCKEAVTTMAFVTLAPDGDRSFTFARKPGADMFVREEDVREEDIENSVIVHAGSCSLSASPVAEATIRALRLGKEKGKLVSFDVNYRNVMWNDDRDACIKRVTDVLRYVDLLKVSEEETEMFGGESGLRDLIGDNGPALVVETLGGSGARCFFGDEIIETEGYRVSCIDATGAGDAFWGGFLSFLRMRGVEHVNHLTRDIVEGALRYGNAAGSICVQKKGAIDALPDRSQVEAVLEKGTLQ